MDNFTNPSQFVSLELVDGSLVYQFNTGGGVVKMKTLGNYAIGGLWYTVCTCLFTENLITVSLLPANVHFSLEISARSLRKQGEARLFAVNHC